VRIVSFCSGSADAAEGTKAVNDVMPTLEARRAIAANGCLRMGFPFISQFAGRTPSGISIRRIWASMKTATLVLYEMLSSAGPPGVIVKQRRRRCKKKGGPAPRVEW
jgi:hypothetical protein